MLARDSRVDIKATNKKNLTALGIYLKHQESGFAAAKVYFMLKDTYGVQDMQAWVSTNVKKLLSQEPKDTVAVETLHDEQKRVLPLGERGKMLDIHLLVATLIATVTFAAAFTFPGGYQNNGPNEGMAVLASKLAFKVFVISDTLAFCCSIAAVYLQFGTSGGGYYEHVRFINVVMLFIFIGIQCTVLAFVSGIYVVLQRSHHRLGLTGFITAVCFVVPLFG
ncbi:hypothetical protein MLD38_017883 [Melastoma candidum]|uniref:Uncharacterized protein n=1 Tax=Melastoma candidum TaxID=119954 RepID=A0ACB9QU13_9MYRT|nr:hypothetical protein MLD38_017883 [Melastoma candidum]